MLQPVTPESTDAIQARQLRRVPYLKEAPMGITIRRGPLPTDHFTMIPNDYLRDARLSWEARGLLAWLMSHASSFKVTEEGMIAAGSFQRDGVRRMVRELETCSYLRRDKVFTPGAGTVVAYVLTDPCGGEAVASDDVETVVRPDQGKRGDTAGQPYDGETVPLFLIEEQPKKTKTTSSSRQTTATRVPEDFEPDEKMRDWFSAEHLNNAINGKAEHEKFMDYWRAQPGERGRKMDWAATWRNWMRTAAERAGRYGNGRPGNSLVPVSGAPYRPSTTDQRVGQAYAIARKYEEQGL